MFSLWSRLTNYRKLSALSLGRLEKRALELLWSRSECTVRELYDACGRKLAYTTLMTTVDRLHKKGLLNRRKEGKAFVYSPCLTREELDRAVARDVIGALLHERSTTGAPLMSCFVDAISEQDEKLLGALEAEIQKRRETKTGSKD